mmetsp:Transcript_3572/g.8470  ORF Transcript_3572/g.8470 Transcript_3572/m.8470 type:complete len:155 (+) Transcript_3572:23-487(+)
MSFPGSCGCGAVGFEYDSTVAPPLFSALCHCRSCRLGVPGVAVHILGIPKPAFKITKGEDNLVEWNASESSARFFCKTCGTRVIQGPKGGPFYGTFPTLYEVGRSEPAPALPESFAPKVHAWFSHATAPELFKNDGLPKFKDFPKEMGGTGEMM